MIKSDWDKLLASDPINTLAKIVTKSETELDDCPYTFYPMEEFKIIGRKISKHYNVKLVRAYNILAHELGFSDFQEYQLLLKLKNNEECPDLLRMRTRKQRPRKRDLIK